VVNRLIDAIGTTLSVIILFGILALAALAGVVIHCVHSFLSEYEERRDRARALRCE